MVPAGGLTNPVTTQSQKQGYELAHLNIHPVSDLLALVMGHILQIQSCNISLTQEQDTQEEPQ